jgi:hypothetical protein
LAATTTIAIIPLIFFGIVAIIIAVSILSASKTVKLKKSRYINPAPDLTPMHERYIPGQFSPQMELDMRLPYRRFKKLYPNTNINYEEYKQMQMRSAFRRSMSSQENKRMVR